VLPALALLAFTAHDLILFLLGKDWLDAADLVVLLAGLGIFGAVNTFNDSLIISQGKSKLLLKITIADKTILAISLLIGLKYGIAGLALAKVFAVVLASVPRGYVVLKLTNINFWDFVKRFNAVFVALIMLVIVEIGLIRISHDLNLFFRLVITILPAASVYAGILFVMNEPALDDLKKLFRFGKR
jgi:O-antigen/teichoic acid export membrane protein